jgi:hypothetical protein
MAFRVEITPLAQQPTVAWCYSIAVHEIRVEDIVAVEWNDGPITDRLLSVVVTFKNGERKGYVGEELAWWFRRSNIVSLLGVRACYPTLMTNYETKTQTRERSPCLKT